jgi:hypothetical protein
MRAIYMFLWQANLSSSLTNVVAECFVTEILTICMSVTLPANIYAGAIHTCEFAGSTHYTAMTNKHTHIHTLHQAHNKNNRDYKIKLSFPTTDKNVFILCFFFHRLHRDQRTRTFRLIGSLPHRKYLKLKTPWSESASELHRPSDRSRRSDFKLLRIRGCHVVSVTNPYGRIFGFLDRSRYFSVK